MINIGSDIVLDKNNLKIGEKLYSAEYYKHSKSNTSAINVKEYTVSKIDKKTVELTEGKNKFSSMLPLNGFFRNKYDSVMAIRETFNECVEKCDEYLKSMEKENG